MKNRVLYFGVLMLSVVCSFSLSNLFGQSVFSVNSFPDSAEVYLNGELRGFTPCKVKYRRKSKSDEIRFEIRKKGYEKFGFVFNENPFPLRFSKFAILKPKMGFVVKQNSAVVSFDKILLEFPNGKVLGRYDNLGQKSDLTWQGFQKIGDAEFETKTYEVLGNLNFKTTSSQSSKLFSGQKKDHQRPRFVLAGMVKDLQVDSKKEMIGGRASKLRFITKMVLQVEWQVFDMAQNEVVYKRETVGHYTQRLEEGIDKTSLVDVYGLALVEFLRDGKLCELVNSSADESVSIKTQDSLSRTRVHLPKKTIPAFESSSAMIQAVTPACVTISTDAGHGSGVLVSENGLILTAFHVIEGVNRIEAILPSGVKLEAEIISADKPHDVALLKIPGSGYQFLNIGDSKAAGLGIDVFTIGTPGDIDLGQSVSRGIVSGKRKIEEVVYIQTDVSVSPGNSGGPLINTKGGIIGIIQRKLIGNGIEGVGFALPIETVLKVLNIEIE